MENIHRGLDVASSPPWARLGPWVSLEGSFKCSLKALIFAIKVPAGAALKGSSSTGLLSNQGEKSIHFYFIMVPLRKKALKYGTPKPSQGL